MEYAQILTTILGILGVIIGNASFVIPLFLWARSEARSDFRHLLEVTDAIRSESRDLIDEIQKEMRDFHSRLISLETRKDLEDYENKKRNANH